MAKSHAKTLPVMQPFPLGFGLMTGHTGASGEYAFILDGSNHYQQRRTMWEVSQYGYSESRLELGRSFGITSNAISGFTVWGPNDKQHIFPHLGAEPFNARISFNTANDRTDHYEWMPMASFGIQAAFSSCHLLPMAKAGWAIGNTFGDGLRPDTRRSYGFGAHVNCPTFDLGASSVRIGAGDGRFQLASMDIGYHISTNEDRVAIYLESLRSAPRAVSERRFMLLFRRQFPAI